MPMTLIPKVGYYALPIYGPGAGEVSFEVLEVEVTTLIVQETEREDGNNRHAGPRNVRPDNIVFPDDVSPEGIAAAKWASLDCALLYYIEEEKRLAAEVLRAGARIVSCHEAIRSYCVDEKDDKEGASE